MVLSFFFQISMPLLSFLGFSGGSDSKESTCLMKTWIQPLGWEDPLEEYMRSIFFPGEFHGQRSLVGDSPWGHKESGTAWQLMHHLVFLHIYSLGGTALLRLPSDARLEVRNAGPGLSSLRCCCVALPSSGPNLVNLPLANYTRSPLVVSSYFQNKQRGGHKEIKPILFEPEAQGVF